jgi:hypothetical protein
MRAATREMIVTNGASVFVLTVSVRLWSTLSAGASFFDDISIDLP